jgi:hypothetical protein
MLRKTIGAHRIMLVICLAGLLLTVLFIANAAAEVTGPTTTIFLSGTHGNGGWFTSDVNVTLEATDYSGLGINRTEYSFNGSEASWIPYTGAFRITKEDMTPIYYRSVDNASIIEPTKMVLVSIDKTPPSLTYILTPAPNANDWTSQDVELHYEVSDSGSGVAIRPRDLNMTNEGIYSGLSATATDNAGNTASITVPTFGIDRTPPVVGNLTVQGNAYVGDYLPVSARVIEANPQRMEWDFGDGTGTTATVNNDVARASHAYKQPGSYRITLNVADKAGHAAKSTATVTIYGTVPTNPLMATPTPAPVTPTPTPIPLPTATPTPSAGMLLIILGLLAGAVLILRKK